MTNVNSVILQKETIEIMAEVSYILADAMIKFREMIDESKTN